MDAAVEGSADGPQRLRWVGTQVHIVASPGVGPIEKTSAMRAVQWSRKLTQRAFDHHGIIPTTRDAPRARRAVRLSGSALRAAQPSGVPGPPHLVSGGLAPISPPMDRL